MANYDARDSKSLIDAWDLLGETQSLSGFLASIEELDAENRELIVDQAFVLIDQLFAHLPLKEARHAINPMQRLRLLRQRLAAMNDTAFHSEMIEIFKGLRDAHTNYGLPRPYAGRYVFLPFLMEQYFESGKRRFLVTKLLFEFSHPQFKPGVEVTHWNGTPVERAVQMNANREEGSNFAARFAFGLSAMTFRDLGSSLPPNEEWMIITFKSGSKTHEIIMPWRIWDRPTQPEPDLSDMGEALGRQRLALSLCLRVRELHLARKHLFAPAAIRDHERLAETRRSMRPTDMQIGFKTLAEIDTADVDLSVESIIPTVLSFEIYDYDNKALGYIRIRTFGHWPIDEFINEFLRILELMPRDGLILDVRGNGGGYIVNGELLLQLLSPKEIEPEPFQFISTELTREICSEPEGDLDEDVVLERQELAKIWGPSLVQTIQTGAQFSGGFPLTPTEVANRLGQRYHGPVVLITDALCYSTTDIFAAGFQDHEIGPIIGVDANTGAGGANVWEHERDLVPLLSPETSPVKRLPPGTTMRVAIRRSIRVGRNAGQPLEDLGVIPNVPHEMTQSDLINSNIDLITHACEILVELPSKQLDIEITATGTEIISLIATTSNLDRLDFIVDGRPTLTIDVADGTYDIDVPSDDQPELVEVKGFENDECVAARKIQLG